MDVQENVRNDGVGLAKINWTLRTFRLDELTDYYKNPRSLSEKEFKQLKTSLDKFGMIDKPIVNLDAANTIIGGHQRKHVLEATGVKECECWIPDRELSEKEVEELNIRLNKNTGSWDFDTLANEFELDDLLDWGFDKGELDLDLWADDAPEDVEPQIDKAEELRVKWGVESGQLWQLGEHRLVCGDCTDKAVVDKVMQGERADMVFTDPPYNVASESRNYAADKSKAMKDLSNAEWDKNFDINSLFPALESIMSADCAVYLCTSHWLVQRVWEWMWSWSDFCSYCVWCKPNPMPSLSKRHWTWATELIPYAVRGHHISNFPDGNHALNWWNIAKQKDTNHPTEKVIGVPEMAIAFSSNDGQIVFDGFLGSGTTLIACERLGRKCRAVEISPAYVAVAIQRWVDVTGKEPVLLDT